MPKVLVVDDSLSVRKVVEKALAGRSVEVLSAASGAEAIERILKICKDHNVPCGHPHPDAKNIERLIASGYRFLMPSTPRSFGVLEQGRKLAGRS